VIEEKMKLIDE
jgi:hypothetical protein